MKDRAIGNQVRAQIGKFSGIFLPRFSKPQGRFVAQMPCGIQAAQDVKLSCISRVLNEAIAAKKTGERLCHHLAVPGYWSCMAVACEPDRRRVAPPHRRLWSSEAPDFVSENHQILEVIETVRKTTDGRGIYVIDHGGDRGTFFDYFLANKLPFIVRLQGDRPLLFRGAPRAAHAVAHGCRMRHAERVVRVTDEGDQADLLEFGFQRVRLPGRSEDLVLVVVRGFGAEPLMLLTNLPVTPSRTSIWAVVQGYLGRWLVEETIRFIKQSYHLEDIRVLDYDRLKNLVALVLTAAYFAVVWLGESPRLSVLRRMVTTLSKRLFGVPEFHYYALADGIRTILSRLGRWTPFADDRAPPQSCPRQLCLF